MSTTIGKLKDEFEDDPPLMSRVERIRRELNRDFSRDSSREFSKELSLEPV